MGSEVMMMFLCEMRYELSLRKGYNVSVGAFYCFVP